MKSTTKEVLKVILPAAMLLSTGWNVSASVSETIDCQDYSETSENRQKEIIPNETNISESSAIKVVQSCRNSCSSSCGGSCMSTCEGSCRGSCGGSCHSSCSGSCSNTSSYSRW